MAVHLEIQRSIAGGNVPRDERFQAWVEAALAGRAGDFNLAIRIVGEDEALRYNLGYRGKDYATNVLSFPMELPEGLPGELSEELLHEMFEQDDVSLLGDIALCAPVIKQEAMQQSKTEEEHWAHMVVHGMLHLQGFDHLDAEQTREMERLEIKILGTLGYTNPYND